MSGITFGNPEWAGQYCGGCAWAFCSENGLYCRRASWNDGTGQGRIGEDDSACPEFVFDT